MTANEVWAKVANKYTVHKETLAFTQKMLADNKKVDFSTKPFVLDEKYNAFDGKEDEILVPSADVLDGIPISVYKPAITANTPAILVFCHGGGLISGSREGYESCLKLLAKESGVVVVNVEYRLLPCAEDKYAPFKDAITVTQWVLKNKESVGGCADSKVGVGGGSSGGQIACIVSNEVREIDFQILVYPVADLHCNLPSFEEFRDTPGFNTSLMELALRTMGVPVSEVADDPQFNPSARQDLELSPPTLVVIAELDPLRDWGLTYAKKLRTAGANVEELLVQGVPHGFFVLVDVFATTSQLARTRVVEFLNKFQ